MNAINKTFAKLRGKRKKALIGYVTAGFPRKNSLQTLVPLLEKAGADILEIGVPFSDPIADGPVIQQASQVALRNGVTLAWIFQTVKRLRREGVRLPLVFMSYANPILAMGLERFFQVAQASGVDGLIVPDLIPEEAAPFEKAAERRGISLIHLAAPTTPKNRLSLIARRTRGFLYAVSLTGVTGARAALPKELPVFLKTLQRASRRPVAVGFGISTPALAREAARHADGIIVGSALLREIAKSRNGQFLEAERFIKRLRRALDQ